jgi:N utilization substance protein A
MRVKYDVSLMKTMSLFERITRAKIKDCYEDEVLKALVFVVQPGQIGFALGKNASNVKLLEKKFNKRIRIIEFHPTVTQFVRNMIMPLRVENVEEEDGIITITDSNQKTKGLIIGRNAANLRNLENNVKRYYPIKEIKVV